MAVLQRKEYPGFRLYFYFSACFLFFTGSVLMSCSAAPFLGVFTLRADSSLKNGIKIASWNTQTFFDAVENGGEFSEFCGAKSAWSEKKYTERLERLCAVMRSIDADFIALQEIENEAVVRDIANMLPVTAGYRFAAFAKDEKNAFGCAVFSRFAIESVKTHQISERTEENPVEPNMRPLMEVRCKTEKIPAETLVLFICHWKSKSGGEEKSSMWRERQEKLLLKKAQALYADFCGEIGDDGKIETDAPALTVALGDFNRTEEEFSGEFEAAFIGGWRFFEGRGGSYFFRDEWERIDHIFAFSASPARFTRFGSEHKGPHVRDGTPFRYRMFNGEGYSDHLPVSAVFSY